MINLLLAENPLEPVSGEQLRGELAPEGGKSLRGYLVDAKLDNPALVVSLNGRVYPPEQHHELFPLEGDWIVLVPRLGNPGLIKGVGAIAVIALATVVTGGLATGPLAGLGAGVLGSAFSAAGLGGLSAASVGLIGGGILLGGNLLVNAIAGLFTPSQKAQSPTYDLDGPRSTAQSGVVIPKGYGKFRWGGNQIASFTDVEGSDVYLNALFCYGYGPLRNFDPSTIEVAGKPVSEYRNVQVFTRLGTNDQTPIGNFTRISNGYPQQTQCLAGIPVVIPGVGTETLIGQVDIQFPDGVYEETSLGHIIPVKILYTIEYSPAGQNQWTPVLSPRATVNIITYDSLGNRNPPPAWVIVATDLPPSSGVVYGTDNGAHAPGDPWTGNIQVEAFRPDGSNYFYNKPSRGEWQPCDPTISQVEVTEWAAGFIEFDGASTQTLYNRTDIYYPSQGKWDVRVTKYGSALVHYSIQPGGGDNFAPNIGQDVWVHSVNEITPIDLSYPNMILIGVRALATSQLSGASLTVTAEFDHGCRTRDTGLLPAELAAFADDNPAVVTADAMLDRLYGGGRSPGIQPANIERFIDEWVAWAEVSDELVPDGNGGTIRRHVFRGVADSEGSLWDFTNSVCAMSRAQIVQIGRDYGVFVDRPDVPVQMFSMGNIGADSFTESFLELEGRANQVELQFADSTRYYKQNNPLVYMDPAFQDAGVPMKPVRLQGKGIVVPAQAWHFARFRERSNEFILRSGSFNCDVDAIACRVGNLVLLQHDVPQWGWGGRTLPGSTVSSLRVDRNDLTMAAAPGTSSVILLYPAIERYLGTVGGAAVVEDQTGATVGVRLTLAAFDNIQRVTRAVIANPGAPAVDCAIKATSIGSVTVVPPPGFIPLKNAAYQLFDTDVMIAAAVTALRRSRGGMTLTLATPLPQLPEDFSVYFFGPTGSQKIVRVSSVRRMNDFKSKIEWVDYDERVYDDATPTIGSTSVQKTTNAAVTSLTGAEVFSQVGGSYVGTVQLSWRPGPDTVGVGVYVSYPARAARPVPALAARLTGNPTTFSMQPSLAEPVQYLVVGFDAAGNYASLANAPSVTITAVGIATNLILGSNFASGFTYWNATQRTGDLLVPSLDEDGEANLTVQGSTLAAAKTFLFQTIATAKWSVGQYLMLSAYLKDTSAGSSATNQGEHSITLAFIDANGAQISSVVVSTLLGGLGKLARVNTPATLIPAGTAQVLVWAGVQGSALSVPAGSVLSSSHWLLEQCLATQTAPSAWADIDVHGQVLELFTTGSSSGLRVQGSVVPTFTGGFAFTYDSVSVTITWSALVIAWPDGGYTNIQNGQLYIGGLTPSSSYIAYPFYDVVLGTVQFATPTAAVGNPSIFTVAADTLAAAFCQQDGHVALSNAGVAVMTDAAGSSGGSGTGGGSGSTGGGGGGAEGSGSGSGSSGNRGGEPVTQPSPFLPY